MPKNTTFLIVQFLTGSGDDIIRNGSTELLALLRSKGNTNVLEEDTDSKILTAEKMDDIVNQDWYTDMPELVGESGIVYLRGHGNWQACTLGGRNAENVTGMLCKLPVGAVVNVVGCNAAVAARADIANDVHGEVSIRSFAGDLHRRLKDKRTRVFARSQPVQINAGGKKVTYGDRNLDLTSSEEKARAKLMLDKRSKRADSKWAFDWQGDTQVIRPVVYPDTGSPIDDLLSGKRQVNIGSKSKTNKKEVS